MYDNSTHFTSPHLALSLRQTLRQPPPASLPNRSSPTIILDDTANFTSSTRPGLHPKWRRHRTNPKPNPPTTALQLNCCSASKLHIVAVCSPRFAESSNFAIHWEHTSTSDLNFICLFGYSRSTTRSSRHPIFGDFATISYLFFRYLKFNSHLILSEPSPLPNKLNR